MVVAFDPDKWIELAKECKYLPENDLKKLCEIVCEILLEESNIQEVCDLSPPSLSSPLPPPSVMG